MSEEPRPDGSAMQGQRLFGTDPASYASGRPGYPSEIYEVLEERCRLTPDTPTLEIGPGAGQATVELLRRGARPLTAVEPDPAFATYLATRFANRVVEVHNTPFETFEMAAGSVRLAASATAWHWVVDQEEGLRRLARYISRGGWCALWWTLYHDPERPDDLYRALEPIMSTIPHVLAPKRPGRPRYFALDRDERMKDIHQAAFEDVRVDEFHWEMSLDPERARSLFGTFSPILALSPSEREDALSRIEDVIRTRFGGAAQRACVSVLYTARRT